MPALLTSVLAFTLVVLVSTGAAEGTRRVIKEGRWRLFLMLGLVFGAATFLWWSPTFGLLVLAGCTLGLIWGPVTRMRERREKKRERKEARRAAASSRRDAR
jgi:hypothetical protein